MFFYALLLLLENVYQVVCYVFICVAWLLQEL